MRASIKRKLGELSLFVGFVPIRLSLSRAKPITRTVLGIRKVAIRVKDSSSLGEEGVGSTVFEWTLAIRMKPYHPRLILCLSLVVLLSAPGCSLLDSGSDLSGELALRSSSGNDPFQAVLKARDNHAIVLHVLGSNAPPKIIPLPTDGSPVFVSDLLKQSGLNDKFARMSATLHRNSTNAIDGVRMGIRFASRSNQLLPEHDYQLQPGDRLEVAELEVNPFESLSDLISPRPGRRFIYGQ